MAISNLFMYLLAFVLLLVILSSAVKVVREYERGVIFRLGRFVGAKGPGLFLIVPMADKFIKIDLRTVAFDVPKQRLITRDNVSVDVDAVVYYRVMDPGKAVVQVEDYLRATNWLAQTTLRDILGQVELDELLGKREELGKRVSAILDEYTDPWGVKVSMVAIKDVTMPESMVRAIAKQAEAEREKRSRKIIAEGEFIAAEKIAAAGELYKDNPVALKLRELQTLTDIAKEKNMVIVTSTSQGQDLAQMIGIMKGATSDRDKRAAD